MRAARIGRCGGNLAQTERRFRLGQRNRVCGTKQTKLAQGGMIRRSSLPPIFATIPTAGLAVGFFSSLASTEQTRSFHLRHQLGKPIRTSERNMAKNRAQETTDHALHAASFGSTWLAAMSEQQLKQGIAALDGILRTMQKTADVFGDQAARIREHSAEVVQETIGNAAEFSSRLARSKDPLEWAEAHSQFLSKQAQVIANTNQNLGDAMVNGSSEVASAALQQAGAVSRKRAKVS